MRARPRTVTLKAARRSMDGGGGKRIKQKKESTKSRVGGGGETWDNENKTAKTKSMVESISVTIRASLRFEKDRKNIDCFRGFIKKFSFFFEPK